MSNLMEKASRIKLVIFDVDGVLTDGSLYLNAEGGEYKAFFCRDGHGMKMLKSAGVEIAILSGRSSRAVDNRMAELSIHLVYQGQGDKVAAFESLLQRLSLSAAEVAYVGDDVIDLPVMRLVGLPIAVADAHPMVAEHASWKTPSPGGRGAAREVCELVMQARGVLQPHAQHYPA